MNTPSGVTTPDSRWVNIPDATSIGSSTTALYSFTALFSTGNRKGSIDIISMITQNGYIIPSLPENIRDLKKNAPRQTILKTSDIARTLARILIINTRLLYSLSASIILRKSAISSSLMIPPE